ncbi:MAG: ribonuclease HII [Actinomycetales bacterium]|nr:ribonuclease HII [Actinomycetales bacterium]
MAGPVMVGVCAITVAITDFPAGLRDSKMLSAPRREKLAPLLLVWAPTAVGAASAAEIDELGITACLGLAAKRALIALHEAGVPVGESTVLLDGAHDWLNPALTSKLHVITRVKADQDCAVVAAASVVAKVHRDALMVELDGEHPQYGWASNKGYGAAIHMDAIRTVGVTGYHRQTWVKTPVGRTE